MENLLSLLIIFIIMLSSGIYTINRGYAGFKNNAPIKWFGDHLGKGVYVHPKVGGGMMIVAGIAMLCLACTILIIIRTYPS